MLRGGHMEHPGHLEHPGDQKKIKLGVPLVQLVGSLVVLMTIISAMVLLGKLRYAHVVTDHGQGMLMCCFGAFGASVSLKMPSFENGCFYIHNIFLSFWKVRPMVWGSSVPPALCAQVSSAAQTVLVIQSGANVVVYQATCPYPSTGSRSGMANVS